MLPIASGTSTERIVRSLLLFFLVDVFAIYFLYDGYVGYPKNNAAQLAALLGLPSEQVPAISPAVTAEDGKGLAGSFRAGATLNNFVAYLGSPAVRQSDTAYFVGRGGWVKIDLDGDRVLAAKWFDAPHTESDQRIQRLLGWILVVAGFAATLNLGRVMATRAQLTDAGLQVTGRLFIPFDSMTGLRPSSSAAGVSELDFSQPGATVTIRLDPYLYKEADAIAQAIAERKGFAGFTKGS